MQTHPFIDRDHAKQIIREARAQRWSELRDAGRWALGAVRWGGLSVLVALGLISGSHGIQSGGSGPMPGGGSALSD